MNNRIVHKKNKFSFEQNIYLGIDWHKLNLLLRKHTNRNLLHINHKFAHFDRQYNFENNYNIFLQINKLNLGKKLNNFLHNCSNWANNFSNNHSFSILDNFMHILSIQ